MDREKDTLQKTDERRTWEEAVSPEGTPTEDDRPGTEAVEAGAGALGGAGIGASVGGHPGASGGVGDQAEEKIKEENATPGDERRS